MITLHGLSHDGLITKQASSSPEFSVGGGNLNTGGTSRCYPNLGGHPSGRKAIGLPDHYKLTQQKITTTKKDKHNNILGPLSP